MLGDGNEIEEHFNEAITLLTVLSDTATTHGLSGLSARPSGPCGQVAIAVPKVKHFRYTSNLDDADFG
ncbi:hypothetical protein [Nocardia salmonicida]|uniref:hypothetical protein n=1 Tax=Nocardia salmonicida TaxID=53431 RepID=UPI0034017860